MAAALDDTLLEFGKAIENTIDDELEQLESQSLEEIRQKRLVELKALAAKKKLWSANGHGTYAELATEKDFFPAAKVSENLVCHFYRNSRPCKVMDAHLEKLAQQHLETRFVKLDAEKSPYLTDKLRIFMLPTLALVKSGKVAGYVVGFDELGGTEDFPTDVLEARLCADGLLTEDPSSRAPKEAAAKSSVRRGGGVSWQ